jgi:hypothetical protein
MDGRIGQIVDEVNDFRWHYMFGFKLRRPGDDTGAPRDATVIVQAPYRP